MSSFKFEAWPTEYRAITQYFGANPQNYAQFKLPGHEGLDIMAPMGSKVFAVAPGQVKVVNSNPIGHNYGIHVRVSHVDGYETIYAHLESASVRPGDRVQAGQELGRADNTGNSFGSHLHLTLKKEGAQFGNWPNNIIDPTPFLLPLLGWRQPAGPYTEGWAYTAGIIVRDELAQASAGGVNLRRTPSVNGDVIDLIPGGTIMSVTGAPRGQYTPVKVSTAALSSPAPPPPPQPAPPPPPTVTTLDGWGWRDYLTVSGDQAVVGEFGINLRAAPDRNATNIGLVRGGSSATVLGPASGGPASGEYLHLRVRRTDFMNPVDLPAPPPVAAPGSITPPAGSILGWAWSAYLEVAGRQGVVGRFGITLRAAPSQSSRGVGLVKGGATVTLIGPARGEYTPVFVRQADALNLSSPMPAIEPPTPFPANGAPASGAPADGAPEATAPPPAPEKPIHDTTPGWAFTTQITVTGDTAVAGQYGINLRDAPRRTAVNKGFVPAGAVIIVTGAAQGEYTPVRVPDDVLQAPFGAPPVLDPTSPPEAVNPDPPALGRARIGLHAAADPGISDAELAEFAALRPGIIKVLSFHDPDGVRKLAAAHPDATWVVRAFLDFGGRNITPGQFVQFTLSDVRRTLDILQGRDVVVELHNEPNIAPEGLGGAWSDGRSFASWWLELLRLYRVELPRMRFIYPGLSPGSDVRGFKEDHVRFIEDSRAAVEAADGLAVHLYWSNVYPMENALTVLDDYISRFRYRPIWVTEASNNKSGVTPYHKGLQYLKFWEALQERPLVHGVTYFVASALNPEFAEEVWVGRGIGAIVGRR